MIQKISIVLLATALALGAAGTENKLDLNGSAKLVQQQVSEASALLLADKVDEAQAKVQEAANNWQIYLTRHNYAAEREFLRLAALDSMATDVTGIFERALAEGLKDHMLGLAVALDKFVEVAVRPMLFDFSGGTCKYCKIMKERLTRLAPEYAGKIRILYINVNTEGDAVKQYRINLIPTLVLVSLDGKEIDRMIGAVEESELKLKFDELIKP